MSRSSVSLGYDCLKEFFSSLSLFSGIGGSSLSTLLYTQLINFERDEYHVKVAESKEKITKLLEAGFEWVGQDKDDLTYFRKSK